MKICYQTKNFRQETLALIVQARAIIQSYAQQGFNLTLRQLYYQFVARGLIDNTERSYKRIGSIVSDARLAGLLDWDSIVDRTREQKANSHWADPQDILNGAAQSYSINLRTGQPTYVEVWIEKDALIDIIEQACKPLDVGRFSCRGYVSQSAMWEAAQRINKALEDDELEHYSCVILHLGDHDPSGIDMTRDIQDRLNTFECDATVERIALTMPQIRALNPPPNPTKLTDSRAKEYLLDYGNQSWELDALDPTFLTTLVTEQVGVYTDFDLFEEKEKQLEEEREYLWRVADEAGND